MFPVTTRLSYRLLTCSLLLLLMCGDVEINPGPLRKVRREIRDTLRKHMSSLKQVTQHSDIQMIATKALKHNIVSSNVTRSPTLEKIIDDFKSSLGNIEDLSRLEDHCDDFLLCLGEDGPVIDVSEKLRVEFKAIFDKERCCRPSVKLICLIIMVITIIKFIIVFMAIYNVIIQDPYVPPSDAQVKNNWTTLRGEFADLMFTIMNSIEDKARRDPDIIRNIIKWINLYMHWTKQPPSNDVVGIFEYINDYYDFMNFTLIELINERFGITEVSFKEKIDNFKEKVEGLSKVVQLKDLKDKTTELKRENFENSPKVTFIAHDSWENVTYKGFVSMIVAVLPHSLQSIFQHSMFSKGSILITYTVRNIPVQSLIDHTQRKLEFMLQIGIFRFAVENRYILDSKEDPNFTFQLALFQAAKAGHLEAVKFLVNSLNVNVNYLYNNSNTSHTSQKAFAYDVLVKSEYGHLFYKWFQSNLTYDPITVLMAASEQGHDKVVEFLLQSNADPNIQSPEDGVTAIILASEEGHYKVVELLLNAKADPNIFEADGWTSLMFAAQGGHLKVLKLLLKEGVDCNHQEIDGWTALMISCAGDGNRRYKTVELLVEADADTNIQDKNGRTAYMIAIENSNTKIIKYLKSFTDLTLTTFDCRTALDVAVNNEKPQNILNLVMM